MKRFIERMKIKARTQYHVNIFDNETFAQRADFNIRLGRLWSLAGLGTLGVMAFTTALIFFTPVREAIPGYLDTDLREKQTELLQTVDNMKLRIAQQDSFIKSIQRMADIAPDDSVTRQQVRRVLQTSGHYAPPAPQPAAAHTPQPPPAPASTEAHATAKPEAPLLAGFMNPVEGFVSRGYDGANNHFGVDLVGPENALVKAVANGTVIFADYTLATGHVIGIKHPQNFISFYKHNGRLLKPLGASVLAGEPIAVIGNSGEHSTGPHLHFELWQDANPVDPQRYIPFIKARAR